MSFRANEVREKSLRIGLTKVILRDFSLLRSLRFLRFSK